MTFSETQHQHPSEPVPASREAGRGAHAVAGLLRHAEPAPAGGARAAAGAARRQPAHAAHARGALAGAPRAARPAPGARRRPATGRACCRWRTGLIIIIVII